VSPTTNLATDMPCRYKDVYEALRNGPGWNDTLFVLTYDEHGGYYDHVPTPTQSIPNPDGRLCTDPPFNFTRLGVRVPTLLISPWVAKGHVEHAPPNASKPSSNSEYEATSFLATMRKLLGWGNAPLTKRDAWSATFEHLIATSGSPRTDCPTSLPEPARPPPTPEELRQEGAMPLNGLQRALLHQGCVDGSHPSDVLTEEDLDRLTQAEAGELIAGRWRRFMRKDEL